MSRLGQAITLRDVSDVEATFKDKSVLVTGHTGFTGGWLCLWLSSIGAKVTGLSLEPITIPNLFTALDVSAFTASHIGNINDFKTVDDDFKASKPEFVFHLAAQPLVSRAYEDPLESFETNVMGTAHVLEASRLHNSVKAVVCITTDKVYADQNWPWGYREMDQLGGKDPYSASKSAAEMVAKAYQETLAVRGNGVAIATARGGNIIGGGDWSDNRIVPDFVRAHLSGDPLTLRNPSAVRPWQHVLALCHGYLTLAAHLVETGVQPGQNYNFGPSDDETKTVGELVTALSGHWPGADIAYEDGHFVETHILRVDSAKAHKELNWVPPIGFKETVAWTADWYREFHNNSKKAHEITLGQIMAYREALAS